MQLTQFSDYSLRVLIHLARLPDSGMATVSEIANEHNISHNHLVKVVNNLANHSLIITTRGRGGGIRLAKEAQAINIGEVVRLTELNLNLVECFDPANNFCRLDRSCALKGFLYEAQAAFFKVLDQYSLADAAGCQSQGAFSTIKMPHR